MKNLFARFLARPSIAKRITRRAIVLAAAEIGKQIGNPVSGEGASDA